MIAGPSEATALGNAVVQAIACGELGGLGDARAVIASSFEPMRYRPRTDGSRQDNIAAARGRFAALAR